MRGLVVPDRTEDFTADPVELFFDLAYVFAFSQLVGRLIHDPTWAGVGKAGLLFLLLWLPWSQFTWSANALSGNGRTIRLFFLVGTAASVPMAASISTAFESGGPVFAISLGVIFLIAASVMVLGVDVGTEAFASAVRWIGPIVGGLGIMVIGGFTDGATRIVVWCVTVMIVVGSMVYAGRGEWIIRSGHFAERHGLILIVAIGVPVVEALEDSAGLPGSTVVVLAIAGVLAGLLWWGYFDRPSPALEHRAESLEGARERGRYVRDVYTSAHAPLVAGIVLTAAALEEIALHPDDIVAPAFRAMLYGGLVLVIGGIAAAVWRAFGVLPKERLAAVAVLGAVFASASRWSGVALLIVTVLIVTLTFVAEHIRIER